MISVQDLSKSYGSTLAVRGISFEIGKGEVVGFLGPNGAGKSTTLRVLSGCLPPTSGVIRIAGLDVAENNLEVRRRVGYLPENNPLYEEMDVSEYLEWTAEARGMRGGDKIRRIRYCIEACGLGEVLGRAIGVLSKGFRQRVGLAAAIVHDPEILLLDEPTSGLDPNQAHEVRELIRHLKKEKTVLLSTHILPEVQSFCDRVIIIHRGAIAAMGIPEELGRSSAEEVLIQMALRPEGLDPAAVAEQVKSLAGVGSAEAWREKAELRLAVRASPQAGDLRARLFQLAVDKRWTILQLHQAEASLENVFRELTVQ